MSEEQGSLGACTVQGRADEGRAESTSKLENNYGEKFELSERERKELKQSMREAKTALEDKETEIKKLKEELCQAKEATVREYRDTDALLSELSDSFLQGFEDTPHQVKKAYLDLDVSNIKRDDQA